ncbi:DEMA protein, partial [Cisticola juncidis]|nr:DEMA protein [Cisticola juncidis]
QQPLTSPGSVCSSRGSSVPGSPSSIVAKMDNEVLGYKDLAALPKDKAILDIERPDLMIYEPHFTYSLMEHVELPRSRERSLSPKSMSPPPSPEVNHHSSAHHGKHLIEDLIIESSKFPAAQPPDPNQPAKIETDYWPCPPSLAVVGAEQGRGGLAMSSAKVVPKRCQSGAKAVPKRCQSVSLGAQVTSNLGKMILKEEMEKSLPIRRKTRSLPDRTPFHTSLHSSSKSSSLPASGRSTLTRV